MQRITESELVRDVRAVLARVKREGEIIVEGEDHLPVAVITAPHRSGRPITEILREARERRSSVLLDEGFGEEMNRIIAEHSKPWRPPSWE
ncbi:MAG: hypothetical protein JSU00_01965 [Acidobacteria bacterium]|nr:hypothetical protein [Acidobacteriota bacterium]